MNNIDKPPRLDLIIGVLLVVAGVEDDLAAGDQAFDPIRALDGHPLAHRTAGGQPSWSMA